MNQSQSAVNSILVNLILTAQQNMEGEKGNKLESWVADMLEQQVETNDNLIPLLKEYVDLPWVDQLEAAVVKAGAKKGRELILFAIRKAFSWATAHGEVKSPSQPDVPPIGTLGERDGEVADTLGVQLDGLTPTDAPTELEDRHEVAGQDQHGNKQNKYGEVISNIAPSNSPAVIPNSADQSPNPTGDNTGVDDPAVLAAESDEDKAMQAYLVSSEYFTGNNWYEFPVEGEAPKRVLGKVKALEYFKTQPDLVKKYQEGKAN